MIKAFLCDKCKKIVLNDVTNPMCKSCAFLIISLCTMCISSFSVILLLDNQKKMIIFAA